MAAASSAPGRRWSAHPWRARGLRLLVYALPVALSLAVVHVVTSLTGTPTGSLWVFLLWWLGVSLLATAAVSVVYAFSRRLLPLSALLELSLVFPDRAPSRFELALSTGTIDSLVERLHAMRETEEEPSTQEAAEILLQLSAALSAHDSITRGHAERVRAYSNLLGAELRLSEDERDRLNWAALLHDIGKLEVPGAILNKPGSPTDEEWEILQRHPELGEKLVEPLRGWLGEWLDAVGDHHERWDGQGYPRGLAREEISRAGRIVAIADVFDVLTSKRSYREPSSMADARAEVVRCAGSQFDPSYVRAFVDASLPRLRLVLGPFAWLTHAPLLARLPLTQSVGVTFGGVAAVAAATATMLAGPTDEPRAALPVDTPRVAASGAPAQRRRGASVVVPRPGPNRHPRDEPDTPRRIPAPGPTAPTEPGGDAPTNPRDPTPPDSPEPDPAPSPEPPKTPEAPQPQPAPPPAPPPPAPPPPTPTAPNQPPRFTAGGDQSVLEDAGAQSVGWASSISPGAPSESGQNVTFSVSSSNSGLFSAQPSVSSGGTLTYTPSADAFGSATVTVIARDDGGTANGGADSSAAASFTVTVLPVNDAPRFSGGGNQVAVSLLGAQSVSGWATGVSPGPANESSQGVSFVVTTSNPGLFAVQPAVSPDGTLTYTPKLLALGTATITVRAVDTGGTANGGVDTSAPASCTITIV